MRNRYSNRNRFVFGSDLYRYRYAGICFPNGYRERGGDCYRKRGSDRNPYAHGYGYSKRERGCDLHGYRERGSNCYGHADICFPNGYSKRGRDRKSYAHGYGYSKRERNCISYAYGYAYSDGAVL